MNYQINSHKPNHKFKPEESLFILSRGNNSGKVLAQSCPNCFRITASPKDIPLIKAAAIIIFEGKTVRRRLIGSVINFIRIGDYKELLDMSLEKIQSSSNLDIIIARFNKTDELVEITQKKVKLLKQYKVAVANEILK